MSAQRSRLRMMLLAAAAVLLLMAFDAVVQAGVTRGAALRSAYARQADAVWRCKLLHDTLPRDRCLTEITP